MFLFFNSKKRESTNFPSFLADLFCFGAKRGRELSSKMCETRQKVHYITPLPLKKADKKNNFGGFPFSSLGMQKAGIPSKKVRSKNTVSHAAVRRGPALARLTFIALTARKRAEKRAGRPRRAGRRGRGAKLGCR